MNKEQLQKIVFEALGEASMCWSEIPQGVFESTRANEIGNRIMKAFDEYSLPSPSLPSDEDKKKSVINKILDDLPIREVRGEMSPDEWYGWFEEVYDKAFSLCSTLAEMERDIKRLEALNKQYSSFRRDVLQIPDELIIEIDNKHFPF